MNKKFSTLMASLLLAGGAFSSAYADKLVTSMGEKATEVASGSKYFLVQNVGRTGVTEGLAIGFKSFDVDTKEVTPEYLWTTYDTNADIDEDIYLWEVTETTEASTGYVVVQLKNVKTGQYLRVSNDGQTLITDYDAAGSEDANASNLWYWLNRKSLKDNSGASFLFGAKASISNQNKVVFSSVSNDQPSALAMYDYSSFSSNNNCTFSLYKAGDITVDEELNDLYNKSGFNFKIKDGVENIFNNGQAIKAIKLESALQVDGANFAFPAATYFVTETPAGAWKDQNSDEDKLNFLLNSTFIAVSADNNASTSADKQKKGEGFQLTTVAGKDLNFFVAEKQSEIDATPASKQTKGAEISVLNAAFSVKENIASKGNYALSLNRIRIKEAANSDAHAYKKDIRLNIISDKSYGSSEYLVSEPSKDPKYIFTFVESTVAKGTSFIKAEGASIYNIQFVGGVADGSYLTSAKHETQTKNFAKGAILTDVDAPAFQYVVTKVDGNNVTFTNRETGESFETMLYPEEGENVYSLAIKGADPKFTALTINNSGDVVEATNGSNVDLNLAWVKLIPVEEVDKFAGYLDVENETKVTLTFARDYTPTSNKLYPMVSQNTSGVWSLDATKMTDDVTKAAQWQLLKSEKPTYKTHTYAYLNDAEKVVYKTKGDTVAYYKYEINLVNDGLATAYKIGNNPTTPNYNYSLNNNSNEFIIKENTDGSVSIYSTNSVDYHMSVKNYNDGKLENLARNLMAQQIKQTSDAQDIKAYLVEEAPEVSLPAEAAYVSFKGEKGNYISMDEERDGVVVNNDPMVIRVFATDLKKVVPSFYITTGWDAESTARMFLMQPQDSVQYYAGAGAYDKKYQWSEGKTKAIFKAGILNETADTLTTSIKGEVVEVAMNADNKGVQGGLESFKTQIILADPAESEDLYIIRSMKSTWKNNGTVESAPRYLTSTNEKLAWTDKRSEALKVYVEVEDAPTANEGVEVSEVSVVAANGAVIVKGAEGKKVAISNILGQTIANTVVSSDNATIAVPAGIVVVAVEGEDAVKVVVK